MKVVQSCPTLCDPKDPMEFSMPEYWSGSLSLLQGIFPTQGWNPGLPHCRQEIVKGKATWYAAVHRIEKSQTHLRDRIIAMH